MYIHFVYTFSNFNFSFFFLFSKTRYFKATYKQKYIEFKNKCHTFLLSRKIKNFSILTSREPRKGPVWSLFRYVIWIIY